MEIKLAILIDVSYIFERRSLPTASCRISLYPLCEGVENVIKQGTLLFLHLLKCTKGLAIVLAVEKSYIKDIMSKKSPNLD